MNSEVLLSGCGIAAVVAAGVWHYASQPPLTHVAAGLDASLSVERNCAGVRAVGKGLLDKPGVGPGSTFSVLAMGADPAVPEPRLLLTRPIPIPSDHIYGRDEQQREYEQAREELLSGIEAACEQLEDAYHTPLYRLVQQGLEHLHSETLKCPPEGDCYFLLKTDLVEDVHPGLRATLQAAVHDPLTPVPPELVGSLNNSGVHVAFCGTSEVRPVGKNTPAPPPTETRQRIWRELFREPERVSFEPFCVASSPQ